MIRNNSGSGSGRVIGGIPSPGIRKKNGRSPESGRTFSPSPEVRKKIGQSPESGINLKQSPQIYKFKILGQIPARNGPKIVDFGKRMRLKVNDWYLNDSYLVIPVSFLNFFSFLN